MFHLTIAFFAMFSFHHVAPIQSPLEQGVTAQAVNAYGLPVNRSVCWDTGSNTYACWVSGPNHFRAIASGTVINGQPESVYQ